MQEPLALSPGTQGPGTNEEELCAPCSQTAELRPAFSLLLSLPPHLLHRVLASAGAGARGACRACRALRAAWQSALADPTQAARYLLSRYGPGEAVERAFGEPLLRGLADALLPAPGHATPDPHQPPQTPSLDERLAVATSSLLAALQALGAEAGPRQLADGLRTAAGWGWPSLVRALVRCGADASADGMPFEMALNYGHLPVARVLLDAGYDPTSSEERVSAAFRAAGRCASGAGPVRLLLSLPGIDARWHGEKGLQSAMFDDDLPDGSRQAIIAQLLAAGAAECGGDALTQQMLMMCACQYGSEAVCRALLAAGLTGGGYFKGACIDDARAGGHVGVVRALEEAGWVQGNEASAGLGV